MFNYNKVSDDESTTGLNICPLDISCHNEVQLSRQSPLARRSRFANQKLHLVAKKEQEINQQLFP